MSMLLRVTMQSIIQGNGHLLHDEASATNRVNARRKLTNALILMEMKMSALVS